MASNTFHCSVVTPERAVLECDARAVVFPAWDGEIGIRRGRAPLLCRLGVGPMRVETDTGEHVVYLIDGGFAQMVDDRLTLLTEGARQPSELDAAAGKEALTEARALRITDEASFAERQRAIRRAQQEINLAS